MSKDVAARTAEVARVLGIDPLSHGAAVHLAKRAGVTRQAAAAWLHGLSVPQARRAAMLERMAAYPMGYILNGYPKPETPAPAPVPAPTVVARPPAASRPERPTPTSSRISAHLAEIEIAAYHGYLGPYEVRRLEYIHALAAAAVSAREGAPSSTTSAVGTAHPDPGQSKC